MDGFYQCNVCWLGGLQLIKPVEMCNPKVDELSMMTYLSQFPHCKLKPGAPLRPKTNPARVRAYGPGMYVDLQLSQNKIIYSGNLHMLLEKILVFTNVSELGKEVVSNVIL